MFDNLVNEKPDKSESSLKLFLRDEKTQKYLTRIHDIFNLEESDKYALDLSNISAEAFPSILADFENMFRVTFSLEYRNQIIREECREHI